MRAFGTLYVLGGLLHLVASIGALWLFTLNPGMVGRAPAVPGLVLVVVSAVLFLVMGGVLRRIFPEARMLVC